jgi:hypothetical protein
LNKHKKLVSMIITDSFILLWNVLIQKLISTNNDVLKETHWDNRLTATDKRAITPLIFSHVNPYGLFKLDMNERITLLTSQLVA